MMLETWQERRGLVIVRQKLLSRGLKWDHTYKHTHTHSSFAHTYTDYLWRATIFCLGICFQILSPQPIRDPLPSVWDKPDDPNGSRCTGLGRCSVFLCVWNGHKVQRAHSCFTMGVGSALSLRSNMVSWESSKRPKSCVSALQFSELDLQASLTPSKKIIEHTFWKNSLQGK